MITPDRVLVDLRNYESKEKPVDQARSKLYSDITEAANQIIDLVDSYDLTYYKSELKEILNQLITLRDELADHVELEEYNGQD